MTPLAVVDVVCGLLLLGVAIVARQRAHPPRLAWIWAIASVTWLAGIVWPIAATWHRGPLVQGLLVYPGGGLDSRQDRAIVTFAYIAGVVAPGNQVINAVVALAVAWTAGTAWRRTTGRDHEAKRVGTVGALVYSGVLTIGAAQSWFDWGWDRGVLIAYMATVAAISVLAMADLATRRWARSAVAGLVIDVGRSGDIGLQDAIRRAVGDPSMQIGFWVPDLDRYVDTAGRPLNVAATRSRITTEVDRDGEKIALLSHDVVTFADPELLQGVAAAARLAYDNAQLQAAAQAHISELSASRRRLVEAAERQRTLLEHDLRKSTFRGLEAAHGLLVAAEHDADGPMKPVVAGVDREVCRARDELDELAHGLRPRALTELGLAGALAELVERMPLLVELDLDIDSLAPALESAIYFVCAEALTNTVKHAGASRATVSVEIIGDWVVARVSDDGLGGARLDGAGSGLRGLAERAETLGGTLVLSGAPSGGTVVEVSIPLGQGRSSGDRELHPGPSHLEHMPTDEGR